MVPEINYWAVLLAMLSSMVVGSLWYTPKLFGTRWARLANVDMTGSARSAVWPIITTVIVSFITAWVLAGASAIAWHFYEGSFFLGTVVTVAKVADSLERLARLAPEEADRRLRSIPGVGVWTSAEVRQRALGDPDAVSFGDYHVAKDVGWALTGTPFDDAELEEFLEPWRPQRGRVPLLVAVGGLRRPRHGPRMSLPTHYPTS